MYAFAPRSPRLLGLAPVFLAPALLAELTSSLGFLGFLAGAEVLASFAAYSEKAIEAHSRSGVLEEARKQGDEERGARLLARLPAYLLSARILRFLAKAALVVALAGWVLGDSVRAGGQGEGFLGPVAWALLAAVLGLAFAVNFVINDVLLGVLARRAPDRFLVRSQGLLEAQRVLAAPLRVPLVLLVRAVFRVAIEDTGTGGREEVRETIVEGQREGALTPAEAQMLSSVMDLQTRTVGDVLVPRAKVSMLQADLPLAQAIAFVGEDGHSRLPVYGRDKDDVLGVLYARDLLAHAGQPSAESMTVRQLMRPAYFVPESKRLHELLVEMKSRRNHMAVAVDELRATAGVISIEDVLEQIVGPIHDEHDEPERRALSTEGLRRGGVEMDARTPVEDANRVLGLALPHAEAYDTLGGLLLHRLGKVPQNGERLSLHPVLLTVVDADERRVKRVRLELSGAAAP